VAVDADDGIELVPSRGGSAELVVPGDVDGATISPDGGRIAYVSGERIVVASIDGTDVHELVDTRDLGRGIYGLDWSPDGSSVAFAVATDAEAKGYTGSIWIAGADGAVRELETGFALNLFPSWSPDGAKIAFEAAVAEHDQPSLAVANVDGSDQTIVVAEEHIHPVWNQVAP
jgi:Tol biopolymer transport system component